MDNKGLRITLDRPPRNTMDLVTARELLRAATRTPRFGRYSSPALAPPSALGATLGSAPPPGRTCPRCSKT
jgi:hypothetical protein